jgi:hypothetical protein
MMAVRIMTQSLFPRIFPGVCPYCVCFIELQGHCIFGQCTDTKVQGAPAQTVGLHNPHRLRKTWIAQLSEVRHSPLTSGKLRHLQFP